MEGDKWTGSIFTAEFSVNFAVKVKKGWLNISLNYYAFDFNLGKIFIKALP